MPLRSDVSFHSPDGLSPRDRESIAIGEKLTNEEIAEKMLDGKNLDRARAVLVKWMSKQHSRNYLTDTMYLIYRDAMDQLIEEELDNR